MTELSRRAVLSTTGRAAVATLALGGVSIAATGDDPVYAAIEAHRQALARHLAICEGEENYCSEVGTPEYEAWVRLDGEACEEAADAAWAMLDTEPTTVAGVAALLAHVGDHVRQGYLWPEVRRIDGQLADCGALEINAIDFAARALARLTGGQANG